MARVLGPFSPPRVIGSPQAWITGCSPRRTLPAARRRGLVAMAGRGGARGSRRGASSEVGSCRLLVRRRGGAVAGAPTASTAQGTERAGKLAKAADGQGEAEELVAELSKVLAIMGMLQGRAVDGVVAPEVGTGVVGLLNVAPAVITGPALAVVIQELLEGLGSVVRHEGLGRGARGPVGAGAGSPPWAPVRRSTDPSSGPRHPGAAGHRRG